MKSLFKSQVFKTRLSRNLISAGVKPSFSARDIHSSPPKGKKRKNIESWQ